MVDELVPHPTVVEEAGAELATPSCIDGGEEAASAAERYPAQQQFGQYASQPYQYAPPPPPTMQSAYGNQMGYPAAGPVGQVRRTGVCILLYFVTLGFYSLYYFFKVHQEMKDHAGRGLGGGIALVLAFFVGIVMPFITSSEIGDLYQNRGQVRPVSGATGLWYFPGGLILVGPFIWFVKTNGALNDHWRSLGTR
ncbi:MAG: DUF4234 domain-containing protein [Nocardioidaceae bacterium]